MSGLIPLHPLLQVTNFHLTDLVTSPLSNFFMIVAKKNKIEGTVLVEGHHLRC